MDFQYEEEAGKEIDLENEYDLEIKIESLSLTQHQLGDIQLIIIFGDLVYKMTSEEGDGGFEGRTQRLTMHAVSSELSSKLLNMPIFIYILSTVDLKPLGSVFVEVNECFANAIKCSDFRLESIKKVFELTEEKVDYGKVEIVFSVSKNIGNSNRHRRFYTEATQEKTQMNKPAV